MYKAVMTWDRAGVDQRPRDNKGWGHVWWICGQVNAVRQSQMWVKENCRYGPSLGQTFFAIWVGYWKKCVVPSVKPDIIIAWLCQMLKPEYVFAISCIKINKTFVFEITKHPGSFNWEKWRLLETHKPTLIVGFLSVTVCPFLIYHSPISCDYQKFRIHW